MDWELLVVFAIGAGLGNCLTFGIFYVVIDTFFVIEDDDEDTEESKN
ncbi:MAG: hypothetical protein UDN34_07115 [Phascolarctobacterium succinatutens]|nr:hypothetical protein [Phascolarctobacterium succinatutens]